VGRSPTGSAELVVPRRRLGVALLLPDPVATEVDGLRRALGDGSLGRIPAHLTLVPPVNVRDDDMPAALDVLRGAAGQTRPLDLRLGPATTFHPATPVIYLGVQGDVAALHALRGRVFHPPLERPLTRPFVPHVTLADEFDPGRIPAAVAALADFVADVRLEAVHLLEEGRGRVWRPIADARFSSRWLPG
jgi:2'-5' RNA ligase